MPVALHLRPRTLHGPAAHGHAVLCASLWAAGPGHRDPPRLLAEAVGELTRRRLRRLQSRCSADLVELLQWCSGEDVRWHKYDLQGGCR
ncbi:unnamed protein product [Urochloa humidicola]